jgi:hypothetical protein
MVKKFPAVKEIEASLPGKNNLPADPVLSYTNAVQPQAILIARPV